MSPRGAVARRLLAAVVATGLLVALSGCRDSRTFPVDADGVPHLTIMVGGLEKVIYLPAMLTQRLGGFERHGLRVDLLGEQSGATAETSLLAGDVQAVVGFYDHTIDLQAKDQCLRSVVTMADVPGEAELVPAARPELRTPADLRGQDLGVTSLGSSTDFLTQALTGSAGMSTQDYTRVKVGAGQTFIAAMTNGGIDAGMTTDPTIAQMTAAGTGRVMVDMRTEAGTRAALGGLYPSTSLYLKCTTVDAHPETVARLVDAFTETLQWIQHHTPAQIAAAMPPQYASGDPALYERSIADTIGMFTADGRMDPAAAQNALRILGRYSKAVTPRAGSIDLGATYTNDFVDRRGA